MTSRRGNHSEPPSLATHLSHAQPAKATGTMPAMTSTSSATATATAPLVADLQAVFKDRLVSVVTYGPHNEGFADAPLTCLALVATLTADDLEACAQLAPRWKRARVATPLILPEDEFRRSLDAFPLEYSEIIRTQQQVFGREPFAGVAIDREDLRRACETQVKSHLLHLREGFIETGGHPSAIATLVTDSAAAFAGLLRNVARLTGVTVNGHMEATRSGANAAGIPDGLVSDLLALEYPSSVPTADPARLFPEYLAAVERLARTVDTWRS